LKDTGDDLDIPPVADAPVADAPVADAPVDDAPTAAPSGVMPTAEPDDGVEEEVEVEAEDDEVVS